MRQPLLRRSRPHRRLLTGRVPLLLNVLLVGSDLSPLEALVNAGDRVKVNRPVENKRHTNVGQHLASYSAIGATIPPLRQTFSFNGLDSFLRHFLRNSSICRQKSLPRSIGPSEEFSMAKLSIYKYVRTDKGWRYCKAAFHPNGKIKPNVVLVSGVEEKHTEGRYFLNFNNQWIDVGENALEAQRKRLLRLNQIEYERLSGTSLPASPVGHPSVVEFSGR